MVVPSTAMFKDTGDDHVLDPGVAGVRSSPVAKNPVSPCSRGTRHLPVRRERGDDRFLAADGPSPPGMRMHECVRRA
jgi:hypothetical protein